MNKYTAILLLALLLAGCYYKTPQAKPVSEAKNFSSTAEIFRTDNGQEISYVPEFSLKTNFPPSYLRKGVENFYDDCNGCLDYVSVTASSMRIFDSSLSYPFIVSLSGALRLSERHKSINDFLAKRIPYYGFSATFASSDQISIELADFYNRYGIDHATLSEPGGNPYLRSIVYSGAIPVVVLNRYYIFEEQTQRYSHVIEKLERKDDEFFAIFVGYDLYMKISDPTVSGFNALYQDIQQEDFMEAWKSPKNNYGKMFTYYLLKKKAPKTEKETLSIIAADLEASHINLKGYSREEISGLLPQAYATRKWLYEYLKETRHDAFEEIKESSLRLKSLLEQEDLNTINADIDDIIEIEKKAIEKLR